MLFTEDTEQGDLGNAPPIRALSYETDKKLEIKSSARISAFGMQAMVGGTSKSA
jgi:hypothetical protein